MDQRIAAHLLYFKFFTVTDTLELAQFGASQLTACMDYQHFPHCKDQTNPNVGAINHFDANIYAAVSSRDPLHPVTMGNEYEDNTYGWLYQLAKSFIITGNISAVQAQKDRIPLAVAHAKSKITSTHYMIPGPASNTYDDFWELPIDAYVASMYPMVMHASALLLAAIGNQTAAEECESAANVSGVDFMSSLFNGPILRVTNNPTLTLNPDP